MKRNMVTDVRVENVAARIILAHIEEGRKNYHRSISTAESKESRDMSV